MSYVYKISNELGRVQFLAFSVHTNEMPVNRVPMCPDVSDSGAYSLCIKLCCLSWWAFSTMPDIYQVINKWCLHEQALDCFSEYFNGLFQCIAPPRPAPTASVLPGVSPDIPFPFGPLTAEAGAGAAIYNPLCCLLDWGSGQSPSHFAPCQIKQSTEVFFQVPISRWLVFVGDLNHVCTV